MRPLYALLIAVLAITLPLSATAAVLGASHCAPMQTAAGTHATAAATQCAPATCHSCSGTTQCAAACAVGVALPDTGSRVPAIITALSHDLSATTPKLLPAHRLGLTRPPSRSHA